MTLLGRLLALLTGFGLIWVASQAVGLGLREARPEPFFLGLLLLLCAGGLLDYGVRRAA